MGRQLFDRQGEEQETSIQALVLGDVAIVGVPAEYFTGLGIDIKQRSPFEHTYIVELANDWIGYLPDREAHRLGGYQPPGLALGARRPPAGLGHHRVDDRDRRTLLCRTGGDDAEGRRTVRVPPRGPFTGRGVCQ